MDNEHSYLSNLEPFGGGGMGVGGGGVVNRAFWWENGVLR